MTSSDKIQTQTHFCFLTKQTQNGFYAICKKKCFLHADQVCSCSEQDPFFFSPSCWFISLNFSSLIIRTFPRNAFEVSPLFYFFSSILYILQPPEAPVIVSLLFFFWYLFWGLLCQFNPGTKETHHNETQDRKHKCLSIYPALAGLTFIIHEKFRRSLSVQVFFYYYFHLGKNENKKWSIWFKFFLLTKSLRKKRAGPNEMVACRFFVGVFFFTLEQKKS